MKDLLAYDAPPWGRAKIGLIIPSPSVVTFHEFQRLCPEGVTALHTRVLLDEATPEKLSKLSEDACDAAKLLATAKPKVISYTCTASAFIRGAAYERDLIEKMGDATGVQTTTMATAVVEALRSLGAKRILIVAPYLKSITDVEEAYFAAAGFEIAGCETLGIKEPAAITARTPQENFDFAYSASRKAPNADAVFISCGGLRTIDAIGPLEDAIGKPVVSSNQCNAWLCLKLAGIHEPIHGYGRLLARER